jgi:transposase
MDAIPYVDRTGIAWRYLPHDFPPWETVYYYFAAWQKEGLFDQLNGLLRRLVREAEGRDGEPTACLLDAPSVRPPRTSLRPAKASTPARKSQAASATSGSTPSACSWLSGSPRRVSPTMSAAYTRCPTSPPPNPE